MIYEGTLYALIGEEFIPCDESTQDIDVLRAKLKIAISALEKVQSWSEDDEQEYEDCADFAKKTLSKINNLKYADIEGKIF